MVHIGSLDIWKASFILDMMDFMMDYTKKASTLFFIYDSLMLLLILVNKHDESVTKKLILLLFG